MYFAFVFAILTHDVPLFIEYSQYKTLPICSDNTNGRLPVASQKLPPPEIIPPRLGEIIIEDIVDSTVSQNEVFWMATRYNVD